MASPKQLLCSALKAIGDVLLVILFIFITPVIWILLILCWIRAKITALIVVNDKRTMLTGEDVTVILEETSARHIINAFFLIKDHFPVEEMRESFMSTIINAKDDNNKPLFPKFTRLIICCAGYLVWSEDDNFNIDNHIRLYNGQRPRDDDELKKLLSDICNTALPQSKPSWEMLVIPLEYGHENDPKTCVLFRINHSITDGVSFARLLFEQMSGHVEYLTQSLFKNLANKTHSQHRNKLSTMLEKVARHLFGAVVAPYSTCKLALMYGRNVFLGSSLKGKLIFNWTTAVKLSTVRDIKNATGTSVNDVFMSCTAAALTKFYNKQNVSPPAIYMPASFQRPNDPIEMRNKVIFLFSRLPTGDMDILHRLRATKATMDNLKSSIHSFAHRWLAQNCFSVIPFSLAKWFVSNVLCMVLVSNVPGPLSKIEFNDHLIQTAIPLPPLRGYGGIGLAIFTYAGDVVLSVAVDTATITNEDSVRCLLDGFVEEMQQLHKTVVETPSSL